MMNARLGALLLIVPLGAATPALGQTAAPADPLTARIAQDGAPIQKFVRPIGSPLPARF
jgi:hypothetical protein